VVALLTNPNLTTITWNSAISSNYITGRDPTDYHVLWGSAAQVLTGEEWSSVGRVSKVAFTNRHYNVNSGLCKFVNDHASRTNDFVVTVGIGGPAGTNDYLYSFYSLEAWNLDPGDTPPNVPGIFAPRMVLHTWIIPSRGTVIEIR
jgi:hypothetical protein